MSRVFDPGKAARKAKKKAEREAEALALEEKKRNDLFISARADQRKSLLSGRGESTQAGIGSILGG